MQKHTKVYMKYFDYREQDVIPCEACGRQAVDIHHINPFFYKQAFRGEKKITAPPLPFEGGKQYIEIPEI